MSCMKNLGYMNFQALVNTFDKDELRCSSRGTDTIDSSLVEVKNGSSINSIGFILHVKYDIGVGGLGIWAYISNARGGEMSLWVTYEFRGEVLPPGLECRGAVDDVVVIPHVVVGINDSKSPLFGDVVNGGGETAKVSLVKGPEETGGRRIHPLHKEGNAENVEIIFNEVLQNLVIN